MGVPSNPADDVEAAHGPVAGKDVLKRPDQDVANLRQSAGIWRTFISYVLLATAALVIQFLIYAPDLPGALDSLFHLGEVGFGRYRLKHSCILSIHLG
jgi:hypothetical protein